MPLTDTLADAAVHTVLLFNQMGEAVAGEVVRRRTESDGLHWRDVFGHLPRRELWDEERCLAVIEIITQGFKLRVVGYIL